MSHARQQIRDAAAALVSSLPTTGSNVYTTRVYPVSVNRCLAIYTRDEASAPDSITPPRGSARQVQLAIEIYVKGGAIDDVSDTIAAEVEAAMASDIYMGGLVKDSYLASSAPEISGETDQPVQKTVLTYMVTYRTLENDAETAV